MRFSQFSLRQWMAAVAILGVALAVPWPSADEVLLILVVLAVPALVISRFPPRVRLALEVPILLVLMVISAIEHQSYFYAWEANEAAEAARDAADWAVMSTSPKARAILRREAAWFARLSFTLRCKAIWTGFLHGRTYPSGPRSREENRDLVDLLWEIKRHKDAARQAHESSFPGSLGP